jgi:hypothetical protein
VAVTPSMFFGAGYMTAYRVAPVLGSAVALTIVRELTLARVLMGSALVPASTVPHRPPQPRSVPPPHRLIAKTARAAARSQSWRGPALTRMTGVSYRRRLVATPSSSACCAECFHAGSSDQRARGFITGLKSGKSRAANTFRTDEPRNR